MTWEQVEGLIADKSSAFKGVK